MDNPNPTDPNQGNMGGGMPADSGMGQTTPQTPAEPVMPEAPAEPTAPVMPASEPVSEPVSEQPAMPADSGMGGEQGVCGVVCP
ncbi:hypothetical protein M1437_03055, partial [Patescibacteria group bacterium]|nr:hypothetical protein [Patescibacteria group bacterium]